MAIEAYQPAGIEIYLNRRQNPSVGMMIFIRWLDTAWPGTSTCRWLDTAARNINLQVLKYSESKGRSPSIGMMIFFIRWLDTAMGTPINLQVLKYGESKAEARRISMMIYVRWLGAAARNINLHNCGLLEINVNEI
ncbi:hypothetical protein AVEN_96837-1 [Araneus ventricosus]|uniref:Uncharacterized protein n=1 Tax=Araneus ventricosus TaxID=182803 RepID=A0A4Y2W0M2_ARAVE|nr:hypothetical protein AVEN_96837-1 [Araneus ventricosus]